MTLSDLRNLIERMPFNKLVGIRVLHTHADGVTIGCTLRDDLKNLAGVMHGGVLATLADAAAGIALIRHFDGRRSATTTDLKINYLRPISEGKLLARAYLLRIGKHLCVSRVDLTDDKKRLAAVALVTYMILE